VPESVEQSGLGELERVPGVGKKVARHLRDLGLRSTQDLKDRDPDELYLRLCARHGRHVDRCVRYVFRCAVYYASNEKHEPELLRWWNWKDQE